MGNRSGVWFTTTVWRKTVRERWDRSNLEMIAAVLWRKKEDDAKMNGVCLKGKVRGDGQGVQGEARDGGMFWCRRECA